MSRGYLNHRYSDDLDFFANDITDFLEVASKAMDAIKKTPGISIIPSQTNIYDNYLSFTIQDNDSTRLKIDFVNDIPYRIGKPHVDQKLGKIDSLSNITTNKISALVGRSEAKDVVDLWQICLNKNFSWKKAMQLTLNKEACLDTLLLVESLREMPENLFNEIKWVNKPDYGSFAEDVKTMCQDILSEKNNSLPGLHIVKSKEAETTKEKSTLRGSDFGL